MDVGYRWVGTMTLYDLYGTEITSYDYEFLVAAELTINNEPWYILAEIQNSDTSYSNDACTNLETGLWAYYNISDKSDADVSSSLWIKYPASDNETYLTGAQQNIDATVISTNATVTASDNPYNCHSYSFSSGAFSDVDVYYLEPDVGIVKWVRYSLGPADEQYVSQIWELRYFGLN